MLTTTQAAELVGVSRKRWGQLAHKYKVHSRLESGGRVRLYLRVDVTRVIEERRLNRHALMRGRAAAPDGWITAEVFEHFTNGLTLPEMVFQPSFQRHVIRALYEEYRTPLGKKPKVPGDGPFFETMRGEASQNFLDFVKEQNDRHEKLAAR